MTIICQEEIEHKGIKTLFPQPITSRAFSTNINFRVPQSIQQVKIKYSLKSLGFFEQ